MIIHEITKRSERLAKLIRAVHSRREEVADKKVSWSALGREFGVTLTGISHWRNGEGNPGKESLDTIASHPDINWSPEQLDQYLDGKFDDQDIDDLLDNGIPEGALSIPAVKQAMQRYSRQELLEIIDFAVDLLKNESDNGLQRNLNQRAKNNVLSLRKKKEDDNMCPVTIEPLPKWDRLAAICRESLKKLSAETGKNLEHQPIKAAKHQCCTAKYSQRSLRGAVDARDGTVLEAADWEALASFCYQLEGWSNDQPILSDRFYPSGSALRTEILGSTNAPHC